MKKVFLYTAFVYLIFVIYGSLVPLAFVAISMDEAFYQFQNIPYLALGVGSRADWVANILLFIPLAFLWMGVLSANRSSAHRLFISCCVILSCAFLCISIEFTQLFFPQRTVSLNDIVAECIGTIIGVSGWWVWGDKTTKVIEAWVQEQSSTKKIDYYLHTYVGGIFLYSVMPLDLTISAVELYHKWNEGRVILIPFSSPNDAVVENMYNWLAEIALWVPVPILWQRKGAVKGFNNLLLKVFLLVVAIEFFQLFVFSRVTDATDIVLGLMGGSIGIWLSQENKKSVYGQQFILSLSATKTLVAGAVVSFLWFFFLMLVFWYPFDFEFDTALIEQRIGGFFEVPFYTYYFGSEFRAITEVFHKTLFFMPLGGILAFMMKDYKRRFFYFWIALMLVMISAIWIEMGQVFLPEKFVSSTDVVLYIVGGMLGFRVAGHIFSGQVEAVTESLEGEKNESKKYAPINDKPAYLKLNNVFGLQWKSRFFLMVQISILSVGLYIAGESSLLPYNVRELVAGDQAFFRSVGLSVALFWCLGFPVWFLGYAVNKKKNAFMCFIYGVGIHSFFSWLFIRVAVPIESMHDVVGFPVLGDFGVFPELEVFFRFFSLFSVISFALFASVLSILAITGMGKNLGIYFALGFVAVVVMLPIHYWVIIIEAATDNLTELMAEEGYSFSVIGVFFYFFVFGFSGSILSAAFVVYRVWVFLWAISAVLISFPLGYMLLSWATEAVIYKYGQVFSALQFLLSPDREHFLAEKELFISYCWANSLLIALACFAQFSFFLKIAENPKQMNRF